MRHENTVNNVIKRIYCHGQDCRPRHRNEQTAYRPHAHLIRSVIQMYLFAVSHKVILPANQKKEGGSVSRVLSRTIIYLWRNITARSCGPPCGRQRATALNARIRPCTGWGLHGRHVSMAPVSSYLTISTLPQHYLFRRCSFLLHFPYSCLRRTLSGIPALRSPDFPHAYMKRATVRSALDP